jgi:hypothetical protein
MLRAQMAELWTNSDPAAATRWMKSLEGAERRHAAVAAVTSVAFHDPHAALALADEFEVRHEEPVRRLIVSIDEASGNTTAN